MKPQDRLAALAGRYPSLWKTVDWIRSERGRSLPTWPEWCFLPLAAAVAVATAGDSRRLLLGAQDAGEISGLAAWRPGQGVYRFDPQLLDALWSTPVQGDLPVELLLRLPEWGVYVETPGRRAGQLGAIQGFFAWMESDANDGRMELRLLLDPEDGGRLINLPIHLHGGGLEQSLWSAFGEAGRQALAHGVGAGVASTATQLAAPMAAAVAPLVSLVLYLCSEAAEVAGTWPPERPQEQRTKRGARLFPPTAPKAWEVGERVGAVLRAAEEAAQGGEGSPQGRRAGPRPHVRRAHWHTYYTGPRDAPTPVVRWVAPVVVGGAGAVPTIHPVSEKKSTGD